MAFPEDLDFFLSTDDFAVAATLGLATVNVIFDYPFDDAKLDW